MWITVLVMALAASFEPFRVAMTVLMLNRPRPVLQLLAFLAGGVAMGAAVGLVVLFVLHHTPLRQTRVTLPWLQIAIGVVALVVAVVLVATKPRPPKEPGKFSAWARQLMTGPSLWLAAFAGLGIALPSVDYLAMLAVILTSGTPAYEQIAALMMFNVVAFALVELPLVAYVVAPKRTLAKMDALNAWIRLNHRRYLAALAAIVGCVLVAVGTASL
jgi:hypothetical protein